MAEANERVYLCEKTVLLNSLYDLLEQLALPLLAADSKAGILCFSFGDGQGEMRLVPAGRDGSAAVRLRLSGTGPDLAGVLFDELGSALRRSRETESRRKDP